MGRVNGVFFVRTTLVLVQEGAVSQGDLSIGTCQRRLFFLTILDIVQEEAVSQGDLSIGTRQNRIFVLTILDIVQEGAVSQGAKPRSPPSITA